MDQASNQSSETTSGSTKSFVRSLWGVRYQVKDVDRSADFYTKQLGFKLECKNLPAFAQVSIGDLKLILSGPGASGFTPQKRRDCSIWAGPAAAEDVQTLAQEFARAFAGR